MNNKFKLGVIIGSIIVFSVLYIVNVNEKKMTKVEDIQEKIKLINIDSTYQIKTLNNGEFIDHMTDGGAQLIGYFKNDTISKITERLGLSYAVITYEYYFLDNKLIFVYEKEEDFVYNTDKASLDYSKLELVFEGKYYFNKEKLIMEEIMGKKRYSNISDLELFLIKTSKENIVLLSK